MQTNDLPTPSIKSLLLATGAALLIAMVVLITAIMPVEYGLDPTGLGRKFGLLALANTATAQRPQVWTCQQQLVQWRDAITITVPPHQGLEYKFKLQKDAKFSYSWHTTEGAAVYFDFHGEPEGDTTGYFKSYQETTDQQAAGDLVAPFTGAHGWYWENKSATPLTVMLHTKGDYQVLGLR